METTDGQIASATLQTSPPPPINDLATALAKAQAKMSSPTRNREVKVATKSGSNYSFRYATLDSIIDHIRKPLTDNGLWFTQTLEGDGHGKYRLVTTLVHESGQRIRSETPLLVQGQGNQEFGSALTYMRRYALTALLGIAADEDDDANAADGNTVEQSTERQAAKKPPPKQDSKPDPLKVQADRIKHAIDACPTLEQLNGLMQREGKTLADIKAASQTGYEFLIDRANKRRVNFAQQPPERVAAE